MSDHDSVVALRMQHIADLDLKTGLKGFGELDRAVFRAFLRLKALGQPVELSSAPLLKAADQLWHELIWKDTRRYMQLCDDCNGEYIHHTNQRCSASKAAKIEAAFVRLYTSPLFDPYRVDVIDAYLSATTTRAAKRAKRTDETPNATAAGYDSDSWAWGCG